jgi:TrmH family RNA methyltransferase
VTDRREKLISSPANPAFRDLMELLAARGIKRQGKFLLFGERVVRDALAGKDGPRGALPLALIAPESAAIGDYARLLPATAEVLRLAKPLFADLDIFGTRAPILACEAPALPDWQLEAPRGLEILLALSDPSNLGACLRSAAAFGASRAILLRECASPFHPKSARAASGLVLATPLARGPSIQDLGERLGEKRGAEGIASLFALDMAGSPLPAIRWPAAGARLLLGEEGQGVPDGLLATRVAIPMQPGAESLNAAAALSVALYAWRTSKTN